LEDNLFLERGTPATNAALVKRAGEIVHALGAEVASAQRARQILELNAPEISRVESA